MRHFELYVSWAILLLVGMVCTAVLQIVIHQSICLLHAKLTRLVHSIEGVRNGYNERT